jgi:cyanophycin synthetase
MLRHLENNGRGSYLEDGHIVIADGTRRHALCEAAAMPSAMGGHARFNIANGLAVAAGMLAAGFDLQQIHACLTTFVSNSRNNPLRANRFDVHGVTVIVDYAHNPGAYAALGDMARSMAPHQTVAVVAAPGDRRDDDLREIGATCARMFDTVIAYESETRGRSYGATPELILDGARAARNDPARLRTEYQIHDALRSGLKQCAPGDVLIFTCASSVLELAEALRPTDPETAERIAAEV